MKCLRSVEGCEQCAAEEEWAFSQGHECGPEDKRWSTLCEVVGEGRRRSPELHRLTHEPERCEDCKAILNDRLGLYEIETRPCPSGQCTEWVCSFCKAVQSSEGPIDCPTCGSWPVSTDG